MRTFPISPLSSLTSCHQPGTRPIPICNIQPLQRRGDSRSLNKPLPTDPASTNCLPATPGHRCAWSRATAVESLPYRAPQFPPDTYARRESFPRKLPAYASHWAFTIRPDELNTTGPDRFQPFCVAKWLAWNGSVPKDKFGHKSVPQCRTDNESIPRCREFVHGTHEQSNPKLRGLKPFLVYELEPIPDDVPDRPPALFVCPSRSAHHPHVYFYRIPRLFGASPSSLDTSHPYEALLPTSDAPQTAPNRFAQPVWRTQGSIPSTRSPRTYAFRACDRRCPAPTIDTKSSASQTPSDWLAINHLHGRRILIYDRWRWQCTGTSAHDIVADFLGLTQHGHVDAHEP